jgi:hypothetical protein
MPVTGDDIDLDQTVVVLIERLHREIGREERD